MRIDKSYIKLHKLKIILFLYPILVMFFVFIFTSGVIFVTFKDYFKHEKEKIKNEFFLNLKKVTKQRVETAKNVLEKLYYIHLLNEKEKLNDILEVLLKKEKANLKNISIKISKKPLKINKNKYIYAYKFLNNKYYYAIESKEKIKEKIKSYIPILFDSFKWGKKGYIFVHDTKGVCYYHINKSLIGKNRWNLNRNGVYVLQKLIKAALSHPNGTYVKYIGYNPFGKPTDKISFILYDKNFDLTIGSGVYLQDLQKSLSKIEKEKQLLLKDIIKKLIIIFSISIVILVIILFFITKYILSRFEFYRDLVTKLKIEKEKKECYDEMTHLYKKNCLVKEFKRLKNENIAIIVIDINDFKGVNKLYGTSNANIIIKTLAKKLKENLKEKDIIGKGKVDEFIIISKYENKKSLEKLIKKLYEILTKPIKLKDSTFIPSIRIGVALNKKDGKNFFDLLNKATSAALYVKSDEVKIGFYNEKFDEKIKEYLEIKNELITLLQERRYEELKVYYQPQMDKNDKLIGMEALVRWQHPKRGLITPDKFLPIAINEGLIRKLDVIIMNKVIEQINKWIKKGYNPGVVSCNLTIKTLENKNYLKMIEKLIKKVDVKYFGIEITEESISENEDNIIKILNHLKKFGIEIALDDFGTGYSNIKKLKNLPIDKLKIDKSFIDGVPHNENDVKLVELIVSIAKVLNLKTIAEGVERKEQRDFVFSKGINYIQGYFYSKPLSPDEIEEKYF